MNDASIIEKWQTLIRKKDPKSSIYAPNIQMFLFAHFLPADIDDAWACVPENKEIRMRLNELESIMCKSTDLNKIPAFIYPDSGPQNVAEDQQIEKWIKSYLHNLADICSCCVDEDCINEFEECIDRLRTKFKFTRQCLGTPEVSHRFYEDYCFFAESLNNEILNNDVTRVLYNYFTYLTKVDDVTYYLLTPRITGIAGIKRDSFEPGFWLWRNHIGFDYGKDEASLIYWNESK